MNDDRIGFWQAFKKAFPFDRRELFLGLIWPAAAGNVAWALLQTVLDSNTRGPVNWAHLVVLGLLVIYLSVDWLRTKKAEIGDSSLYWIFDSLLVLSIAWLSIALQIPRGDFFLTCSLGGVFAVAILGHLLGAWKKTGEKNWPRFTLAACGFLGLILLAGGYCSHQVSQWNLVLSFGTVLTLWIVVRTVQELVSSEVQSAPATP